MSDSAAYILHIRNLSVELPVFIPKLPAPPDLHDCHLPAPLVPDDLLPFITPGIMKLTPVPPETCFDGY